MDKIPEHQFLNDVLRGNADAVEFALMLGRISQAWDDLYDGDKRVDRSTVNAVFWDALVALPVNAFYIEHFNRLHPLITSGISDWMTANQLDAWAGNDRVLAYVLRDSMVAIVVQSALLIGGYSWMNEVAPTIRRYYHDETLEEYLK